MRGGTRKKTGGRKKGRKSERGEPKKKKGRKSERGNQKKKKPEEE